MISGGRKSGPWPHESAHRQEKLFPNGVWFRLPQKALLVGGWTNQFEKYDRQIGSSPQVRLKKIYLKPPPHSSTSSTINKLTNHIPIPSTMLPSTLNTSKQPDGHVTNQNLSCHIHSREFQPFQPSPPPMQVDGNLCQEAARTRKSPPVTSNNAKRATPTQPSIPKMKISHGLRSEKRSILVLAWWFRNPVKLTSSNMGKNIPVLYSVLKGSLLLMVQKSG